MCVSVPALAGCSWPPCFQASLSPPQDNLGLLRSSYKDDQDGDVKEGGYFVKRGGRGEINVAPQRFYFSRSWWSCLQWLLLPDDFCNALLFCLVTEFEVW